MSSEVVYPPPVYELSLPSGIDAFKFGGKSYKAGQKVYSEDPCFILRLQVAAQQANKGKQQTALTKVSGKTISWSTVEERCNNYVPMLPPIVVVLKPELAKKLLRSSEEDTPAKQGAPPVPRASKLRTVPQSGGNSKTSQDPPKKPPKGKANPNASVHAPLIKSQAGDPVELFSGRFTTEQTDLFVEGIGLPISMTRFYQSGQSYFGPFGWGWDHGHNRYLRELDSGDIACWTGMLSEITFKRTSVASYDPPSGIFQSLSREAAVNDRFVLRAAEGLETLFERPRGWTDRDRIPIVAISDRFGNRLSYSYDNENRLKEILDTDGNGLFFGYGGCGLLEEVRDHSGREVQYHHAEDVEHLVRVSGPAPGVETSYTYGRRSDPRPLRHAITRVEDGDATFVLNTYIPERGEWDDGRVESQLVGDYLYQYRYTQLQYVPPAPEFINIAAVRTEVLAPDKSLSTHTFNYRGDLIDHRFRLVVDKSYRIVATQYVYDTQGNRSSIVHPDGMEERMTYADTHQDPRMRGHVLRHEVFPRPGFPVPSRILYEAEYEPTYQLLRLIRKENRAETRFVYDFDLTHGGAAKGMLRRVDLPDVTRPDGVVESHHLSLDHNARGQLVKFTDGSGLVSKYAYGAVGGSAGRLVETLVDPAGLSVREEFEHDSLGQVIRRIGPSGEVSDFEYDEQGRIKRSLQPEVSGGRSELRVTYDEYGGVRHVDRPRGDYDDSVLKGRPIRDVIQRNALGHVCKTVLGANTARPLKVEIIPDFLGRPVKTISPDGIRTEFCYDERGLVLREKVTGPDGSQVVSRFTYDLAGRMIVAKIGPTELRVDYDSFGRPWRETLPNGSVVTRRFENQDRVSEEKVVGQDGIGQVVALWHSEFEYDERDREIRTLGHIIEGGQTTGNITVTTTYDAEDRPVEVTDQRGIVQRVTYDNMGRSVTLTDPLGNRLMYLYDASGRVKEEHLDHMEAGRRIVRKRRMKYDVRGRIVQVKAPGNEVYTHEYDDRNVMTATISPGGRRDTYTYGPHGVLQSRVRDAGGFDAIESWVSDAAGRPLRYSDPEGMVTELRYDGLGRLSQEIVDGIIRRLMTYDDHGQLSSVRLADGGILKYGYNAVGLLSGIEAKASGARTGVPSHTFLYDGLGRMVQAEAGGHVTTRRYDSLARLLEEKTGNRLHRVSYNDATGAAERSWSDGRVERIETDVLGRPTNISRTSSGLLGNDPLDLARFEYAGTVALRKKQVFGSVISEIQFDSNFRPVSQSITGPGGAIEQQDYRFDVEGRTGLSTSTLQSQFRFNTHDTLGRLSSVADGIIPVALSTGHSRADQERDLQQAEQNAAIQSSRRQSFVYDKADIRLEHHDNGVRSYRTTNAQELARAGLENFQHDANGDRVGDGQATYEFDMLGRLVEVKATASGHTWHFEYDALGRLVEETSGNVVRNFGYFGDGKVEEFRSGVLHLQFTQGLQGMPLAIHKAGASLVPVYDLRANKVGLLDASGSVVESYSYDAFGLPTVKTPNGTTRTTSNFELPPVFGGLSALPGIDLYLSKLRPMDPRNGTFLSPDPQGAKDSSNIYAYVGQNPADYIDPDGEALISGALWLIGIGAVTGFGFYALRHKVSSIAGEQQQGFDRWEAAKSAAVGAAMAPIVLFAPELAYVAALHGYHVGVVNAIHGKPITGMFDVATSTLPLYTGRAAVFSGMPRLASLRSGKWWMENINFRRSNLMMAVNNPWLLIPGGPKLIHHVGVAFAKSGPSQHNAVVFGPPPGGRIRVVDKLAIEDMVFRMRSDGLRGQVRTRDAGPSAPGALNDRFIGGTGQAMWSPYETAWIPATSKGYLRMRRHAQSRESPYPSSGQEPSSYELFGSIKNGVGGGNCCHFTLDVLRSGGIHLGFANKHVNYGAKISNPADVFSAASRFASQRLSILSALRSGFLTSIGGFVAPSNPSNSGTPPAGSGRSKS